MKTRPPEMGVSDRFPSSNRHLTVGGTRRHHFQNEFYGCRVARYFVNPYSCSAKVRGRRGDFFHSLNRENLGHGGDDQNLFFI